MTAAGYWPSPWSCEDGGPARRQLAPGFLPGGGPLRAIHREVAAATMVVIRDPGEVYLLRHTGGDDAISWVEQLDPETLACVRRSPDLAGGPTWPGSIGAHANGDLYVVFGNHAHRVAPDLTLVTSVALPQPRPYNGFVVLADGTIVTKDFAGSRPGHLVAPDARRPCELVALEPEALAVLDRLVLPEPSVARLSASGARVSVVGDTSLIEVEWDGAALAPASRPPMPYRTIDGQSYGWDCVVDDSGTTWFLDNGDGSDAYTGTLRGHGRSRAPLHLVRVDTAGTVALTEVCGIPGGLVANPPLVDTARGVAVAYDSGNGVLAGFAADTLAPLWRRQQDHGAHLVLDPDSGALVTHDFQTGVGEHVVVLDVTSGEELDRVATASPVQSVLFPAVDHDGGVWSVSFLTVSRIARA